MISATTAVGVVIFRVLAKLEFTGEKIYKKFEGLSVQL